jgi:hypothetical protein
MSVKRPIQTSQIVAFPVRVRPIGHADHVFMQMAMAAFAHEWSVELLGICTDEATLALVPDGGDDAAGPSFVIGRETYGFRVDQLHWDTVTEMGVFASLNDVIEVLRMRLALCSGLPAPGSTAVH